MIVAGTSPRGSRQTRPRAPGAPSPCSCWPWPSPAATAWPSNSVVVGAFPDWLIEESGAPARVAAEIALRRSLLPGHPLAFVEPAVRPDLAMLWHAIVGALLADAGDALAVVRRRAPR